MKRINWKKRYLNLRKKLKRVEEDAGFYRRIYNNDQWEKETGRR